MADGLFDIIGLSSQIQHLRIASHSLREFRASADVTENTHAAHRRP
jgi:hypothetical protein